MEYGHFLPIRVSGMAIVKEAPFQKKKMYQNSFLFASLCISPVGRCSIFDNFWYLVPSVRG